MFTERSGDSSKVDKIYQTWFSGTNVFAIFFSELEFRMHVKAYGLFCRFLFDTEPQYFL